ncbi:unnamed protein product [Alternaria alternata]
MKTTARSLLALAALLTTALAAPTPASGVSFPITDLLDKDLTVEEYAAQLENQSVEERGLTKRQYNGDACNRLTDGTTCRPITVIYARGTTQAGNVGEAGSEGPTFFDALASRVGGISRLAIQGVNYPANVVGFLAGGDAAGAARVTAVETFGDADRDETFGPVAANKVLIICHEGDNICDNGLIITPQHRNYEIDAPTVAAFVAARV